MRIFKVHIVLIILVIFALATVASSAMAHCGHDSFASGESAAMDMPVNDAAVCAAHSHGQASAEINDAQHSGDHGTNPASCDECSGVPCQSQFQVPEGTTETQCIDADAFQSQGTIQFKNIFLSIIPDPPNSIS